MKNTNGHRWTNDELKSLMALWAEHEALDVMAAKLGVTRYSILKQIQRLRKEGIPLERRKKGHVSGRSNQLWTQEEVQYLMRRRSEGGTYEEVSTELGRSFNAICGMVNKLRKENIPIAGEGRGLHRQWDTEALKAFALKLPEHNVVALDRSEFQKAQ